jgi:hypothetical protein
MWEHSSVERLSPCETTIHSSMLPHRISLISGNTKEPGNVITMCNLMVNVLGFEILKIAPFSY